MGSNLKQAIMDTARQLFNEKGFHNTSMRDIAAVLQISVGNLTYHYRKKEDLIEAIAVQDYQKYKKMDQPQTLAELDQMFRSAIALKSRRPYYFKHYVQLSQICPAIYEMQISVLRDWNEVLAGSFHHFVETGILKKEFQPEYGGIITAIMTLMIHGLPNFHQMPNTDSSAAVLSCVWSIILPCLTEEGHRQYQSSGSFPSA